MKGKFAYKTVKAYIRYRAKMAGLLLAFAGVITLVTALYQIRMDAVVYALALCAVIAAISMAWDLGSFYQNRKALYQAMEEIGFSLDGLPQPTNETEALYQEMLQQMAENQKALANKMAEDASVMSDYYAMWIHQIKVPISAMHLLMGEREAYKDLKLELFKIEQYVEMALSYVRLRSDFTDYVIKEHALEDIVRQAVRKYAPLFIAKKITLDIATIDARVITDEKWLQFVIEQILSNALKYTRQGRIFIYMEQESTLVIEDTGIGVAPEDIPRLGEKGFTGYNGRMDKKSTGLGLYLCKEITGKLSHGLSFASETGKGTKVSIHLGQERSTVE